MRAESTMHVLLLTNAVAPDKLGGLERYVRELAAQLVREGVQATVLARRLDASQPLDEIGDDGVRIVRHHSPSKASPLFVANYVAQTWRAGRRAIREHEPRIVHAHFPVSALAPALGTCRYLYTFHAPVYRELLSERHGSYMLPRGLQSATVGTLRRAERLVVRRAARVVTLSEYMRGELRRLDAATADRAALIPGGVDVGSFSPATSGRHAEGAPLLFCARRLTPRTGVRELLHAMPAVLAELPHARLAVAGTGVMETELRRDVVRLQLERSVSFLGR
ncbi:MAG: glycosyltransferase, partial [Actinomycetia bacterium]|nr:glycosyltransferase [Actinomycetes bacterium]